MATLTTLFLEWTRKEADFHAYMHGKLPRIDGRNDIDIARDILALASKQRPGQVIIRDELVDHPIIQEIASRKLRANMRLRNEYKNPESRGVVMNGACRPAFLEGFRMMNRASDLDWANLPGVV